MEEKEPKKQADVTHEEKMRRANRDTFFALGLVSKLGITIAIIAGGFLLLGIYLDRYFSTGKYHIFLFLGLILSLIVSVYDIYWLLEPIIGSDKRKNFLKRKKK